jgi:signal transduction histidine kinase/CheY-like chemotaxis protein
MEKPRILVVEDERDVSKVISINLKLENMDVVEAYDGSSALEQVAREKPDCVVLDIMLPKISGWDILRSLKSNPETAEIPVVMVTAKVAEKDQLRGLGAGAVKYITKPFSPMALTDAIKSVLKPQVAEEVARARREAIERLQLSTLHKVSDILISAPSMEDLLEGVADKLMGLFELPFCALVLSNDETEVFAYRNAGSRPGKGKSISRGFVSRDIDSSLRTLFKENRRPAKIDETDKSVIESVFPGSPVARGYLLPLFERNEYLGTIIIAGSSEIGLSLDEEDLLATIANQVAAAVGRARLMETLREDEMIRRQLLRQTITAQETERRRLAAEIHDSVLQSMVGLSYNLQATRQKIPEETDVELRSAMKNVSEKLNDNIKELRELLLGLRPPMLDDMGLYPALETYLKSFGARSGIHTTFHTGEKMPVLNKDAQINVFRAIQECLNNVEKHAKATNVTVEVEAKPNKFVFTVRDNGKGFNVHKQGRKQARLGIACMRERVELLGGAMDIKSEQGHGTVVTAVVPLGKVLEV